jgi:PST family polysaccharide transporter/lipopolysaccharide exporter
LSSGLTLLVDRFDDFWTGTSLGAAALGFYSRAYEFARYPRRAVSNPITAVLFPTYARLQYDRLGLSKAYYRATALMIRLGFLLSVVFALVVPEFVRLFLGHRWLPIVVPFRLMIVYTLLDPLIITSGHLVTASGQPEILTKVKACQLAVFVPAVIVLGHLFGISGVALAADLMLVAGVVLILPGVRRFVDISLWTLLRYPGAALLLAGGAGLVAGHVVSAGGAWVVLVAKGAVATSVYAALLVGLEYGEIKKALAIAGTLWNRE